MSGKENAAGSAGGGAPAARAFSPTELKGMLGQCLKMASENKITPQNTWALPLIEHLPELIREEGGAQTNFQRASVTLDAGVKIYSYRVDSVHTETFKILGGLGRASKDDDDDDVDGALAAVAAVALLRRPLALHVRPLQLGCAAVLCCCCIAPPCADVQGCIAVGCNTNFSPASALQPASWGTAAATATGRRAGAGGGGSTSSTQRPPWSPAWRR